MIDFLGWRELAEIFLLPPASLIVLMVAGAALWRRMPRFAALLWGLAAGFLYLFSLPLFANAFLATLEMPPVDLAALPRDATAIVVLSGDSLREQPEFGGETVGPLTLQRLRYAAHLHRATGLPVLVTGGRLRPHSTQSIAFLMKQTLEQEFGVPVRWLEEQSRTTFENAVLSARQLRADGVDRAVIVTQAWHMPRAMRAFAIAGMDAVAAPTAYVQPVEQLEPTTFLPRPGALANTYFALHEWIGLAWYAVLDRINRPKGA